MIWFDARNLARTGIDIRRIPWEDHWLRYYKSLWWIVPVDPATGNEGTPAVVKCTDILAQDLLGTDWTTSPMNTPTPPDGTGTNPIWWKPVQGTGGSGISITFSLGGTTDAEFVFRPQGVSMFYPSGPPAPSISSITINGIAFSPVWQDYATQWVPATGDTYLGDPTFYGGWVSQLLPMALVSASRASVNRIIVPALATIADPANPTDGLHPNVWGVDCIPSGSGSGVFDFTVSLLP